MFCHLKMSIVWIWIVLISGEFIGFRGKKLKKCGKKFRKCRVLGQKHRTSWAQTSVLLMQNLRTLWQRSPMFPVFRPEMPQNPPVPDFAIFRTKAGCGGFRGPSQGVNDGVREAGGIRKRASENIAHSSGCSESEAWFTALDFILGFHPSFSRHGND